MGQNLVIVESPAKAKTISKNSIKTIEKILKEINKLIKKKKNIDDIKDYQGNLDN